MGAGGKENVQRRSAALAGAERTPLNIGLQKQKI
jgi:hypothetical protein